MVDNPLHDKHLPLTSVSSGKGEEVLPDVYCYPVQIVNVYLVGHPDQGNWVLVDAGMPRCEDDIIKEAAERFGRDVPPRAIILTHGHFDHVGAVVELAEHWDVPVYAHSLELPYLTGQARYAPPDTDAGGGVIPSLAGVFPREPVDLGERIRPLPEDGSIPCLADWRWLHTPGHTPGHVSLFRDEDSALLTGDAFVTVKQESLYQVFTQHCEISGPPRYFTPDWEAAHRSVQTLAELAPQVAMTGHGQAMSGEALRDGLRCLLNNFEEKAMPDR
ncbi:MBL fold metallo-hydrolase [Kushneria indalinina]|uniref:Glyoxylase-like metal-dependent hydrolase (Beta-lactamase superfamily II) n=1 Tax=Kushneria indalinina DSM 14324 TaxID=1122140 RepID=A0A3D9DUZ9_9GAMM|nr:MBL fold metallo-hydrolase [Kushneria indalinina]REC94576.1 glyoxylase-like metal-dependent hydrolase (beta-lactamase superfamily II) [Kushneria indalinina DSM 14324]